MSGSGGPLGAAGEPTAGWFLPPREIATRESMQEVEESVLRILSGPGDRDGGYAKHDRVVAYLRGRLESGCRDEVLDWLRRWLGNPPTLPSPDSRARLIGEDNVQAVWGCVAEWAQELQLQELCGDLERCLLAVPDRFGSSKRSAWLEEALARAVIALLPVDALEKPTPDEWLEARLKGREPRSERRPTDC